MQQLNHIYNSAQNQLSSEDNYFDQLITVQNSVELQRLDKTRRTEMAHTTDKEAA